MTPEWAGCIREIAYGAAAVDAVLLRLAAIRNHAMGSVSRLEGRMYRGEDLLTAMQKASFQAERAGKA